jgi:hypothetical protein
MLVERIEQIGIVEEVYGDSLFIRWVISGSKKIRSWGWISSHWVLKRNLLIFQIDELSIK